MLSLSKHGAGFFNGLLDYRPASALCSFIEKCFRAVFTLLTY